MLLSVLSLIKTLNNSCVLCYPFKELIELWGGFLPSTFSLNLNLMGKKTSPFLELLWHNLHCNLKIWKSLHQTCLYSNGYDNCFRVLNYETLGLCVPL